MSFLTYLFYYLFYYLLFHFSVNILVLKCEYFSFNKVNISNFKSEYFNFEERVKTNDLFTSLSSTVSLSYPSVLFTSPLSPSPSTAPKLPKKKGTISTFLSI